jgi:hypothetical protein
MLEGAPVVKWRLAAVLISVALLAPSKKAVAVGPLAVPLVVLGFKVTVGQLVTVGTAAYEVVGVALGARSAAFARADEDWRSDPPGISEDAMRDRQFPYAGGFFDPSETAVAAAASPTTGSKVTVEATSQWNVFRYQGEVTVNPFEAGNPHSVIMGAGFARGSNELVVERAPPQQSLPGSMHVPLDVTFQIPRMTLIHHQETVPPVNRVRLRARLNGDLGGRSENETEESWEAIIFEASASLSGPDFADLEVDGDLSSSDFGKIEIDDQGNAVAELHAPIERTVRLMVPFAAGRQDPLHVVVDGDISITPLDKR